MTKWHSALTVLTVMLLAAGLATDLAAQPRWDVIASGGWNNASLTGGASQALGSETLDTYNFGVAFLLRMDEQFGFEFGIRYTEKGGTGTIDSTYAVPNFKNVTTSIGGAETRLDYVELPILLAGMIPVGGNSYLRGYAGPALGIYVNGEVKGAVEGEPFTGDMKDLVKNIDWSGIIGASFHYEFNKWSALVDGRYAIGIASIDDSDSDLDIKTRTWSFSVGVGYVLASE